MTGGTEMYDCIEKYSAEKAKEMGVDIENGDYLNMVFKTNSDYDE